MPVLRTFQQVKVVMLLAAGHTQSDIAEELCLTPYAIRNCLSRLYREYNVPNTTALIVAMLKRGDLKLKEIEVLERK